MPEYLKPCFLFPSIIQVPVPHPLFWSYFIQELALKVEFSTAHCVPTSHAPHVSFIRLTNIVFLHLFCSLFSSKFYLLPPPPWPHLHYLRKRNNTW